eukprot:scaffold536864_cov53-Prasinocladus_malaysianus.AAC.1
MLLCTQAKRYKLKPAASAVTSEAALPAARSPVLFEPSNNTAGGKQQTTPFGQLTRESGRASTLAHRLVSDSFLNDPFLQRMAGKIAVSI